MRGSMGGLHRSARRGSEARSGELGGGFFAVEDDDEECGDGSDEDRDDEPEDATAIFGLGESGVDKRQRSPTDVVARICQDVDHTRMLTRRARVGQCGSLSPEGVYNRGRRNGEWGGRRNFEWCW